MCKSYLIKITTSSAAAQVASFLLLLRYRRFRIHRWEGRTIPASTSLCNVVCVCDVWLNIHEEIFVENRNKGTLIWTAYAELARSRPAGLSAEITQTWSEYLSSLISRFLDKTVLLHGSVHNTGSCRETKPASQMHSFVAPFLFPFLPSLSSIRGFVCSLFSG